MCGIFGFISTSPQPSNNIIRAMLSQQNRGHDAWGICSIDSADQVLTYKQTGAIEPRSIPEFYTKVCVSQNRYQTSGTGGLNEIQPFTHQRFIMAHNGQITNIDNLTDSSDSMLIFSHLVQEGVNLDLFEEFEGAYSLIGYDGQNLFAVRDPWGFRPLFIGRGPDFYAFASESQALYRFGASIISEVPPGNIFTVSPQLELKTEETKKVKPRTCFFESMYFSSIESSVNGTKIIDFREKFGLHLAQQIKKTNTKIDLVIPIPDTSIPATIALAETLQVPYREYILKNPRALRTFITRQNRQHSIVDKYFFMNEKLRDKSVLLVDDSIVRGSTLRRINNYLRSVVGVREIHVASTCPPIKHPCAFGIDFPSSDELVANHADSLTQLDADSIHYLELSTLKKLYGKNFCFACLDGDYPVPVKKEFFEARIAEH